MHAIAVTGLVTLGVCWTSWVSCRRDEEAFDRSSTEMCCSTENADKEFTGEIYHTTGETSPGDICLCKEHLVTHVHTFCMVSDITAVTGDAIVFSSDCFGACTRGKLEVAWQRFDLNIKRQNEWQKQTYMPRYNREGCPHPTQIYMQRPHPAFVWH